MLWFSGSLVLAINALAIELNFRGRVQHREPRAAVLATCSENKTWLLVGQSDHRVSGGPLEQ